MLFTVVFPSPDFDGNNNNKSFTTCNWTDKHVIQFIQLGTNVTPFIITDKITYNVIQNITQIRASNVIIVDPQVTSIETYGFLTKSPLVYAGSINTAINYLLQSGSKTDKHVFILGNPEFVTSASFHPVISSALILPIKESYSVVDTVIPKMKFQLDEYWAPTGDPKIFKFKNYAEQAYLQLGARLLAAPTKPCRTVTVHGLFGEMLKFPLTRVIDSEKYIKIWPVITSKKINLSAVFYELIWFLRAEKNIDYLLKHNVKIWNFDTTREALDKRGLVNYSVGDVGPIYGSQWRNWGCINSASHENGLDGQIDQLQVVIDNLIKDPWDRRAVISAWNPSDIPKMALPPCHYAFQFVVTTSVDQGPKILNCIVNMRSSDFGLGLPFNIASYALLTHLICHIVDMRPGELMITLADSHLYTIHDSAVKTMLANIPLGFPTLEFGPKITKNKSTKINDYLDLEFSDISINYYCNKFIYMPFP